MVTRINKVCMAALAICSMNMPNLQGMELVVGKEAATRSVADYMPGDFVYDSEDATVATTVDHTSYFQNKTTPYDYDTYSRDNSVSLARHYPSFNEADAEAMRCKHTFAAENSEEARSIFKYFPEIQENIQHTYDEFLVKASLVAHPEAPQVQIESCILETYRMDMMREYIENLERALQAAAPGALVTDSLQFRLSVAKSMFYHADGSFINIPNHIQERLFGPITELQNKLAKIAYNPDGSAKSVLEEADRVEWAHLVAEFAEKYVYKDRAAFELFLSGCREQGLQAFSAIADAKIGKATHVDLQRHGRFRTAFNGSKYRIKNTFVRKEVTKETIIGHRFKTDFKTCVDAINAGNFEVAGSIIAHYQSIAHTSHQMREYADMLSKLHKSTGGMSSATSQSHESTSNATHGVVHATEAAAHDKSASVSSSSLAIAATSSSSMQWPKPGAYCIGPDFGALPLPIGDMIPSVREPHYEQYLSETNGMLADMKDHPLYELLTSLRNYTVLQFKDVKEQGGLLLSEAAKIHETRQALENKYFQEFVQDIIRGLQKTHEPIEVVSKVATELTNSAEGTSNYRQIIDLSRAVYDCARRGLCGVSGDTVERFTSKVMERFGETVHRPAAFVGESVRGIAHLVYMATDHLTLRTPQQQAKFDAERAEAVRDLVAYLEHATPEQIHDFAAVVVADYLALAAVSKAHSLTSTNIPVADAGEVVEGVLVERSPMALQDTAEVRVAVQQAALPGEKQLLIGTSSELVPSRSVAASSVPVVKGASQKAQKMTAAEKAAQKELRAKERKYLNEFNEREKIKCKAHNERTVKGRHELTELPEQWHEIVPGDREHEILTKPYDHTRRTHVDPALPQHMNENPRSIMISYEHITAPELSTYCSKGEISGAGFHHDHLAKIEQSGLVEIRDKELLPLGCYKYEWSSQESQFKPSTFFPSEWTRAQVIEKIYESMEPGNTLLIEYIGSEKYTHLGLTAEGIPIISVISVGDSVAKVITAYPDFATYNKLLEGNI